MPKPRTLKALMESPPSPKAVKSLLHVEPDEYMRDVLRGLKPNQIIHLPTPWGYYGLKMQVGGTLEIMVCTINGPTRGAFVSPRASNVVEIHPLEM